MIDDESMTIAESVLLFSELAARGMITEAEALRMIGAHRDVTDVKLRSLGHIDLADAVKDATQ